MFKQNSPVKLTGLFCVLLIITVMPVVVAPVGFTMLIMMAVMIIWANAYACPYNNVLCFCFPGSEGKCN